MICCCTVMWQSISGFSLPLVNIQWLCARVVPPPTSCWISWSFSRFLATSSSVWMPVYSAGQGWLTSFKFWVFLFRQQQISWKCAGVGFDSELLPVLYLENGRRCMKQPYYYYHYYYYICSYCVTVKACFICSKKNPIKYCYLVLPCVLL